VSRDYGVVLVDQDRIVEAEGSNAIGDLADLPRRMSPGIARVMLEIPDWLIPD
jgi:hypothetical protein